MSAFFKIVQNSIKIELVLYTILNMATSVQVLNFT